MKKFLIPLVSCIAKHQSLITCSKIRFVLRLISVHSVCNSGILSFNVGNDVTSQTVQSFVLVVKANLLANVSGDLFEVHLLFCNTSFS